jgi:iron-sulfur cluster repair protein YtfE (RIC family)
MDDLDLMTRTGLPGALRVLADQRPRSGWSGDPGFDGLVKFWMERHMMFREILDRMQNDARSFIDGGLEGRGYGTRLSRLGGLFVNELHGHHMIEDEHYFPQLAAKDRRLARGFEMLDADHHALDGWLNAFADGANEVLSAMPAKGRGDAGQMRDRAGALEGGIGRLKRLLNRHLTDEEDLVVPIILLRGFDGPR